MHYSIIIHHSSLTIEWITHRYSSYRFNNPFITMMIVLFTPSDALFKHQSIQYSLILRRILVFDKRYNTPSHIIAMFNQMQFILLSIPSTASSYGCIHIDSNCSFDYSKYLISSIFWI